MSLIALIILAVFLGWAEAVKKLDIAWIQTAKYAVTLSAPLWLGGFWSILAVFLLFQAIYIPVRNKFQGKDIWFIDKETWFGETIVNFLDHYFGEYFAKWGGRVLYIAEFVLAILILLV
jgi:hypothetical protein